ncbi:AcrR family transcriptional regulator [Bradyrhizobium diazoefficiens]
MDNATRSERSRNAALEAAIAIIARDGPGRLTLDAIARESGLSKGGVMHQFRTKEAVLKALLERQMAHFEEFSIRYMAKVSGTSANPNLATQLATIREAATSPNSAALALVAAMVENPDLMALPRELEMKRMAAIKEEAADPDLAMLRWAGALEAAAELAIRHVSAQQGRAPATVRAPARRRTVDRPRTARHDTHQVRGQVHGQVRNAIGGKGPDPAQARLIHR